MEFCELTLVDYICGNREVVEKQSALTITPNSDKRAILWHGISTIMGEICNGLSFIHSCDEIHRHLKPANSKFPSPVGWHSSLFNTFKELENCWFWFHGRRFLDIHWAQASFGRKLSCSGTHLWTFSLHSEGRYMGYWMHILWDCNRTEGIREGHQGEGLRIVPNGVFNPRGWVPLSPFRTIFLTDDSRRISDRLDTEAYRRRVGSNFLGLHEEDGVRVSGLLMEGQKMWDGIS